MKQIVKGAVIGAICGVAAPVGLAVANEVLFAHNKYNDVTAARICFAERTWSLFRLDIKYAKGCKNGLLDSVPLCLVIGVLGGSLLGALSLVSKNTAQKTTDKPAPSATAPQEPVAASIPEQTSDPVETSFKDAPKPSLPSIAPQVSQGLEQLKEINWVKAGAGAAVAGVVAIVGVGTINLLKGGSSPGEGLNPFRQKVQRQYYVVEGYSKPFVKESRKSITFEPVSTTKEVCRSKKDNAIDQSELTEILSNGGRVITQGGEVGQEVDSGFTFENYGWKVYVNCFYIPYIIEE